MFVVITAAAVLEHLPLLLLVAAIVAATAAAIAVPLSLAVELKFTIPAMM